MGLDEQVDPQDPNQTVVAADSGRGLILLVQAFDPPCLELRRVQDRCRSWRRREVGRPV